ncbi:MAG TPA: DinB family protein [Fimbriimonadaceae bacterium]|nr:DinB family protein [Fimbriimonadaceae bacterium]
MQTTQYREALRKAFQSQYKRIEENFMDLTPEQLQYRPDEKTWSLGQVFLHIWLANDKYLVKMSDVVLHTEKKEKENQEYKPGFFGSRFIQMVGPTGGKNTPVPKILEPDYKKVPDDIVQRVLDQLTAIEEFLDASEGKDIVKTRITSPVAKALKLRLGDVFKLLEQHNERHINQAMRFKRVATAS